jgi:hypothetical protein
MTPNEKKSMRKKLLVNRAAQSSIIKRSIYHWYFCTSLILMTMAIFIALSDPSRSALLLIYELWGYFSPAIVASVVVLPLFIFDILKLSHKIAGPLERLSAEMQKLADGESVEPLRFRDGDYWPELAEKFNELAEKVQSERKSCGYCEDTSEDQSAPALPC